MSSWSKKLIIWLETFLFCYILTVTICISRKYRFKKYITILLGWWQWAEAESKEMGWDHLPELTLTSPYVHCRVDSITFTMGNTMTESTTILCRSRLYPPVRDLIWPLNNRKKRPEVGMTKNEKIRIDQEGLNYRYACQLRYGPSFHISSDRITSNLLISSYFWAKTFFFAEHS